MTRHPVAADVVTLTAFRVLMVWVYDRTESLLLATLKHSSYIFTTLFVFAPPTTGVPYLIYSRVFACVLWAVVSRASPHQPAKSATVLTRRLKAL